MGGVAFAQQDLQDQINQLKAELEHLKRAPMDVPSHRETENPIHKKFNVFFNFQSSFDAVTPKNGETELGFKARQLRLEIRGDINEHIFYRFRHRLNRTNEAASLDNLSRATDIMYAGFRLELKSFRSFTGCLLLSINFFWTFFDSCSFFSLKNSTVASFLSLKY